MVLQILKLSMVVAPNQGISGNDVHEPESCWAAQCWRHVDAKFSMLLPDHQLRHSVQGFKTKKACSAIAGKNIAAHSGSP